ncbi:MAG: 2-amino-4-hydroxy-6-hydroxymethyldihydropteridine diphosphokinase [Ignavibacteriae bacterium]|nr:2-amino-4-hydroxy-6-hydroxymethyldihydropteridine diphosphokinase [Ignavibacteriota bacterium]
MSTYRAFIGLGSNVGERFHHITDAAVALRGIPRTSVVWFSPVYDTDAWGKTDQARFLNAACEVSTELEPAELLAALKEIETRLGRTMHEHWGPREIDLDILLYDGMVVETPEVCVPHRDLANRRFVLVPLRDIAPDLVHPISGLTVEEMASACSDQGRVVRSNHYITV